jgi:ATP-dependent RNA helicase DHX29
MSLKVSKLEVTGKVPNTNDFRDTTVRISYAIVSEASFACRHAVEIQWGKPQEIPDIDDSSLVEVIADVHRFTLTMTGIATPDTKQSEAFAATSALFCIFSGNNREEKVGMKLPPVWRDLWTELAEAKKNKADAQDRSVVKSLRDLVRQRQDQELEDGVILQGAFRGRGNAKNMQDSNDHTSQERSKQNSGSAEIFKKIWADKSRTGKFQAMLVSLLGTNAGKLS